MRNFRITLATVCIVTAAITGTVFAKTSDKWLHTAYKNYFPIGAAVASTEYNKHRLFTGVYKDLLPHFNSLTPENAMKPNIIHPSKGKYNFAPADKIVNYAIKNNYKVRGHVLVWYNQTKDWMGGSSKDEAKANMKSHIETVMGRYKNKIYTWDVVNEAISDGGGYREECVWFNAYGDETYIRDAFIFANEVDPNCKLFYNDYCLVVASKRKDTVRMIKDLQLKKHGLNGVGIQAHWKIDWPSTSVIQETIDTFYDMGLEVHITELDIDMFDGKGNRSNKKLSTAMNEKLAKRYQEIFSLFRKNRKKISSVSFWGIADDHTWLDYFYNGTYNNGSPYKSYPLLFDDDHNPKPAFQKIINF